MPWKKEQKKNSVTRKALVRYEEGCIKGVYDEKNCEIARRGSIGLGTAAIVAGRLRNCVRELEQRVWGRFLLRKMCESTVSSLYNI